MLTNTKNALKVIGQDVVKLAQDTIVGLPKGISADVSAYAKLKKDFLEYRKALETQQAEDENPQ